MPSLLLCLPDGVFAQVLRELPREAQLRLRLPSQQLCSRVTSLLSGGWTSRIARFERWLGVPAMYLMEEPCFCEECIVYRASFYRRFCSRFGVQPGTWTFRIAVYLSDSTLEDDGTLAAVAGTALDIALCALVDDATRYYRPCVDLLPRLIPLASQLVTLDLDAACIGFDGAVALAPLLALMSRLTELNIRNNEYQDDAAELLGPVLSRMPSLQGLDLSFSFLGILEGAEALAPHLASMTRLTSLSLSGSGLDPSGAEEYAPALAKLTGLTSLDLSWNNLDGVRGVGPLLPALAQMTRLTALDLTGDENDLYGAGVTALAPVLATITGLRTLSLDECSLTQLRSLRVEP